MFQKGGLILFLLFCVVLPRAAAQPTLPYISGEVEDDNIVLSWVCPYNSVKEITVLRSFDSSSNYYTIGYVEELKKGIQEFTDPYPVAGKNYYKLSLQFKSGLKWSTSWCMVDYDTTTPLLPVPKPAKPIPVPAEAAKEPKNTPPQIAKTNNTTLADSAGISPATAKPRPKLEIADDDPVASSPGFIKSRYISADLQTGHIRMSLPDDVQTHQYSIRFYNRQNNMVVDIPHINTARILIDKRNFQRKGTYKFVLRKDGVELEGGYISVL
jgi:hypothetical protein